MKMALNYKLLLLILPLAVCQNTTDIYIAALFPMTGWWAGGMPLNISAHLALDHVNARGDLLPGYKLRIESADTKCIPRIGTKALHHLLTTDQPKLMLLGPSTSDVSEATAQIAYVFNVVQLSTVAVSPTLSNQDKYPLFFRVSAPEAKLNPGRLGFLKEFGWKKVSIICQNLEFMLDAKYKLEDTFRQENITVTLSKEISKDPKDALTLLKEKDSRIIFGFFLEPIARTVFCQAYKMGLTGKRYVWIVMAWYENKWWTKSADICSADDMYLATIGVFSIGAYYLNPEQKVGIANLTSDMYSKELYSLAGNQWLFGTPYAAQTYDSIWVIALALNETITELRNNGSTLGLEDFQYGDNTIMEIIKRKLSEVKILGVKGPISFDENGDPRAPLDIRRIVGNESISQASYDPDTKRLSWSVTVSELWEDGTPPVDSVRVQTENLFVPIPVYGFMSAMASLGILMAAIFLVINILFRQRRIIKMSSPNINNIILVGCMMSYMAVFFEDTDGQLTLHVCQGYLFSKTCGFSLIFGALFAKTWRIYLIFSNEKLKKKVIKDRVLIAIVAGLLALNLLILVTWLLVSPMQLVTDPVGGQTSIDADTVRQYYAGNCSSPQQTYFFAVLYAFHGLLLLFGAFLAWETRKVHVPALNDSKNIGMCLYNMLVLTVMQATLYHALGTDSQTIRYVLISLCQLLAITVTQMLVFVPKVVKLREAQLSPEEEAKFTNSSVRQRHVATEKTHVSSVAAEVRQESTAATGTATPSFPKS